MVIKYDEFINIPGAFINIKPNPSSMEFVGFIGSVGGAGAGGLIVNSGNDTLVYTGGTASATIMSQVQKQKRAP